ncbi:MAG: hypothetical protein JRF05_07395 [Deltaproteobacteria bacterium]|nr:hypothetical protein [Deltaproteobacteria bacterium]
MKDKGITVVFAIYDPVGGTVIKSLADPGENITGNQICGSVLKKLDWLLKFPPGELKLSWYRLRLTPRHQN